MPQKTIFLSIYNGIRAKNFFHTDIYRVLVDDRNVRLVIAIPSVKLDYYRKTFSEPNVEFVPFDPKGEPWFGRLLAELGFNLLNTVTIRFKQELEYRRYKKLLRFLFKRFINRVLGPLAGVRELVRFLDRFVGVDPKVAALFRKYKPDLVLAPDVVFPLDRIFLRAAKREGYYVIGLTRSWDNLTSKGVIQILPDKLILHTTRMKNQAVKLVGMPEKDIFVSGPPDYDKFFRPLSMSREQFLSSFGIPDGRRIILFAPFYDDYTGSAVTMMNALTRAIKDGRLPKDTHIISRYRPATPEIPKELIEPSDHLTITKPCSLYFRVKDKTLAPTKDWEFSASDVELLANSLAYSDVVVNTYSTLAIDASAFDKPVIGVRFDADPNTPPEHSVLKIGDMHDHYRELEGAGGVRLVKNIDELILAINSYFEHPEADREGRRKILETQVEFTDGQNARRAAEFILKELYSRDKK